MGLVFGLSILFSPAILALLFHIFRDARGKARNSRGECYSCGKHFSIAEHKVLSHHKGGIYSYCKRCGNRHELWNIIGGFAVLLAGAATLGIVSVSTFDTDPQKSWLLAGIALVIVVFVMLVTLRLITKKRDSS
jgi:hypothetical protein